jgi:lysophospholipase
MRLLRIPIGVLSTCVILVAGVAGTKDAKPYSRRPLTATSDTHDELDRRALAEAPNGYAPAPVKCPSTRPSIRAPSELSREESQWLAKRRPVAADALKDLLGRIQIPNFDGGAYIDNNKNDIKNLPNIGIAASGGGYRALMNGAGALQAFDSRTPGSAQPGHLGGLLQSATYVSGLSGGGWLVGSIFVNNFTSVQAILDANAAGTGSLWAFDRNIVEGPKTQSRTVVSTASYFRDLYNQVQEKRHAGFEASVTDFWGRGLAYQLVNASQGGLGKPRC